MKLHTYILSYWFSLKEKEHTFHIFADIRFVVEVTSDTVSAWNSVYFGKDFRKGLPHLLYNSFVTAEWEAVPRIREQRICESRRKKKEIRKQ